MIIGLDVILAEPALSTVSAVGKHLADRQAAAQDRALAHTCSTAAETQVTKQCCFLQMRKAVIPCAPCRAALHACCTYTSVVLGLCHPKAACLLYLVLQQLFLRCAGAMLASRPDQSELAAWWQCQKRLLLTPDLLPNTLLPLPQRVLQLPLLIMTSAAPLDTFHACCPTCIASKSKHHTFGTIQPAVKDFTPVVVFTKQISRGEQKLYCVVLFSQAQR